MRDQVPNFTLLGLGSVLILLFCLTSAVVDVVSWNRGIERIISELEGVCLISMMAVVWLLTAAVHHPNGFKTTLRQALKS